ncbi:MAG: AAA family ATPase [bacterium]|nr:AAA family ATPase [bacterium]
MTQKEALDILKMGSSVFLTGAPGSGKTFLLNEYIGFLKGRGARVGVTASTGIAATHLSGLTIHSWAGIGIKDELTPFDLDRISQRQNIKSRIKNTKVLVIDEVSMLHSFRLDLVDQVCRAVRRDERPFGGIQVVLCGDFFQLPPISRGGEDASFVNSSRVWSEMDLKICYLHEQHRHSDSSLIQILREIRENNVGEETLNKLRERRGGELKQGTATKLFTHNANVDAINRRHLEEIKGREQAYDMRVNAGNKPAVESLKKSCLAPEELRLKEGAAVMFVKNNPEQRYFNGTMGTVIGFNSSGFPIVQTADGRKIIAKKEDWNMEEDGKIKASISQLPLRLAWAITIHKSQGMSMDAAEIDLSSSFVEGMGYVAISRVKTLNGLRLLGLNDMALKVNEEILSLDEELARMSERATGELKKMKNEEKEKRQKEFAGSVSGPGGARANGLEKISTYDITKNLVGQTMSVAEMAAEREMTEETIVNHLEKLIERGDKIDIEHLKPRQDRFEKIKAAFEKSKSTKLTPARRTLGPHFSYSEIKLARLFL